MLSFLAVFLTLVSVFCNPVHGASDPNSFRSNPFSQSTYSFSTFDCTPGTLVGSVSTNRNTGYFITVDGSRGQFAVSSSGRITIQGSPRPDTYTLQLSSSLSPGSLATVNIRVRCSGNGNGNGNGRNRNKNGDRSGQRPVFDQRSYAYTFSDCTGPNVITSGWVGTPNARNAVQYSLSGSGSDKFWVDSAGNISRRTGVSLPPITYRFTITATSSAGNQASAQVSVNVNCGFG